MTIPEPTAPGSPVLARYMGQGDLQQWVLTYPTGSPVWVSGSTRCTWASLTDQQSPEVTTDADGTDNSDEPITTPYPPSDPQQWDRTPKRRGFEPFTDEQIEAYNLKIQRQDAQVRAEILYRGAFRPDLTEQDTA